MQGHVAQTGIDTSFWKGHGNTPPPFPVDTCNNRVFSVALRSRLAKLVFTVWTSPSSYSRATELVIELVLTGSIPCAGHWGYSIEERGSPLLMSLEGEKASFD